MATSVPLLTPEQVERLPERAQAETYFYAQATQRLTQAGFDVLCVNCNQAPQYAAAEVLERLTSFFAPKQSTQALGSQP